MKCIRCGHDSSEHKILWHPYMKVDGTMTYFAQYVYCKHKIEGYYEYSENPDKVETRRCECQWSEHEWNSKSLSKLEARYNNGFKLPNTTQLQDGKRRDAILKLSETLSPYNRGTQYSEALWRKYFAPHGESFTVFTNIPDGDGTSKIFKRIRMIHFDERLIEGSGTLMLYEDEKDIVKDGTIDVENVLSVVIE